MTHEEESREILEEIRAGMAAVSREQLLEAPSGAGAREPGEPSLGEADEYLKRFFWYLIATVEELKPLIEEGRRLAGTIKGPSVLLPDGSIVLVSPKPEHFATAARLHELRDALEIPVQLHNSLWLLFYAEARRRNPKLRQCARPIVCVDWTFSDADYDGEQGSAEPFDDQDSFPGFFLHPDESNTPQ